MRMFCVAAACAALLSVSVQAAGPATESLRGHGLRYEAEMRRGDELFVRREYPHAVRSYERAKDLAPSDLSSRYRIALTAYVWGDAVPERREDLWTRALEELDGIIALDPLHPDARLLRGLALYRSGRVSESRDEFARLSGRVRQGDPEIWLDLAAAALAANDRPTATQAYLQAKRVLAGRENARAERIGAKLGASAVPSASASR